MRLYRGFVGAVNTESQGRHFPGDPVLKASPSNALGVGSIPDGGAKIRHASRLKTQNNIVSNCNNCLLKQYCNKFNKDFTKCSYIKKKKSVEMTQQCVGGPHLTLWRPDEQTWVFRRRRLCQDHSINSCLRLSLSACLTGSRFGSPTVL